MVFNGQFLGSKRCGNCVQFKTGDSGDEKAVILKDSVFDLNGIHDSKISDSAIFLDRKGLVYEMLC